MLDVSRKSCSQVSDSGHTLFLCFTLRNRALNIDTLGSEVLGSLFTLYGEGALMKKANEMELVLVDSDLELALWTRLLSDDYSKITPRVSRSCCATRDTPQCLE